MVKKYWKDPVPFGGMQHREYLRKDGDREGTADLTGYIRSRLKKSISEKELEEFFRQKGGKFGLHHNTAYRKFRKMLSVSGESCGTGGFPSGRADLQYPQGSGPVSPHGSPL